MKPSNSTKEILLVGVNARYIHASLGLRYLLANMGDLRDRTGLLEFEIQKPVSEIVATILAQDPKIVGFGVYIWNVTVLTHVVAELKRLRPDIRIVLGGPEVSHETLQQEIVRMADCVITGEGDLKFAALCRDWMEGRCPQDKVIPAELPDLQKTILPYVLYSDEDIAHRVIYVEVSRGCPFTCEFCLSSMDEAVRQFPLDVFLKNIQSLMDRGARQFKFVDRTFNLNLKVSCAILDFFLERDPSRLFLHFEMVPDRLPDELRQRIVRFPKGSLQLEIGIQSFDPEVGKLISRRQNFAKVEDNLQFLRRSSGAYLHVDLIAGLPGESMESFGKGFDRLVGLNPHEIQLGILKRLRGTPIIRHDGEWKMVYQKTPPYEIISNRLLDEENLNGLKRFAKFWDRIANSGNFVETTPLIWGDESPFKTFWGLSESLYGRFGRTHSLALEDLMKGVWEYLVSERGNDPLNLSVVMLRDYQRGGREDVPIFLREWVGELSRKTDRRVATNAPKRQARALNF